MFLLDYIFYALGLKFQELIMYTVYGVYKTNT